MDQEKVPQAAPALQDQIDALVEAVNDDDLLEVLSALRTLDSEQLNSTHSSTGFSPLQSAVLEQHQLRKLIVHLLLAKGASYTAGEQNAIELARQCGTAEMFELLRKWDRGERERELEELARYLLTLTDEEAAAWREQTIAEELQHEDQLEQAELAAIFNREQSRLNPLYSKRTPRPTYCADLPPIRWPASPDSPHVASVIRLENIDDIEDDEDFIAFIHRFIEPAMIHEITVTRLANAYPYAHIYLTTRVDVSSLLRSLSYCNFHGKRPHARVGSRLIHIRGIPRDVKRKALLEYLKAANVYGGDLKFREGKVDARSMYVSVHEADAVIQRFDEGTMQLSGYRLKASWSFEESEIHRPSSELAALDTHLVDRADAATFAFRVSTLGWRTTIREYTTGNHTCLPAPLSATPTLHLSLSANSTPWLSSAVPPATFKLFFGNLPQAGLDLADVMDLCHSILGHLPVDVRFETMPGFGADGGSCRLAAVEVGSRVSRSKKNQRAAGLFILLPTLLAPPRFHRRHQQARLLSHPGPPQSQPKILVPLQDFAALAPKQPSPRDRRSQRARVWAGLGA